MTKSKKTNMWIVVGGIALVVAYWKFILPLLIVYVVVSSFSAPPVPVKPIRPVEFKYCYKITYVDSNHVCTNRTIWTTATIKKIGAARSITAWCDLRNDTRTFYVDRMESTTLIK